MAYSDGQIEGGDIYRISNLTDGTAYTSSATAKACDLLEYRVRLYNPGSATLTAVHVEANISTEQTTSFTSTITASSPDADPGSTSAFATVNLSSAQTLNYVPGTTQLLDQNDNPIQTLSDGITISGTGVNIGNIGPSVIEYVQFQEKVSCPTPVVTPPSYACTILGLTAEENRTVKISNFATTQANGATFANATITWGDNTEVTSASPIGQSHQYAANGKYTVTATANFNIANGQPKSATSESCTQVVTFTSTTPPTVTPPTTPPATPPATPAAPTALVNTGPGSVIGLFAATSIGGTALYRRLLARRLSRQ
jgi:hypothetical protein